MLTRRTLLAWLAYSADTAFRQGVSTRSVKPQPRGKPSGRPFAARLTDVAAQALEATRAGKAWLVPGVLNKLLVAAAGPVPRGLKRRVAAKVARRV